MSSLLEDRYRRALRMLPTPYRLAWEDDMVATFLQAAYAADPDDPEGVELGRPSRSELASIAALAIRLRVGGAEAPHRSFAWGEAVRRVALVGMLVHAATALSIVAINLWIAYRLPGLAEPNAAASGFFYRLQALLSHAGLLWLPAYLSVLFGHYRAGRVLALLTLTPIVVAVTMDLVRRQPSLAAYDAYFLLYDAIPILALVAFQRGTRVEPRRWLVALPVSVAVTLAAAPLMLSTVGNWPVADLPALWCVGVTVAAITYLVATAGGRRTRAAHWLLALALLATAVLGLRVASLLTLSDFAGSTPDSSMYLVLGTVEAVAVLITGVTLAALATRTLRRLPAWPAEPIEK